MERAYDLKKAQFSRRATLKLAGAGAVGALLAACAPPAAAPAEPGAAESGEVTLTLSSWWNKPFQELMPKFNEQHPDIKLELIDEEFGAHHDKLLTALVAGTGATDITGIEDSRLLMMADTGGLADISDYMEPYKDKIVPYKLNLGVYQGKNYSVPWDGSPVLLYYRRDVCEQYGIDPESIQLYDDLLTVGMQLNEASDGKVKLFDLTKDGASPWLINFAWQQGGGLVDINDENVIIDGAEGVRAMEYIKRLWDADVVHKNIGGEASNAAYKDGASALFPGAIWLANIIKGVGPETEGKWGVTRVPAFDPGGSRALTWGGSQLAIPMQSEHIPEAFKFLEFTQLSQEGQTVLWEIGDLFPVLIEAKDWEIMNKPVPFYNDQEALRLYAEVNAEVLPYAFGKQWLETSRIVGQQQAEALDGNKTPEQALADAAQEIRNTFNLG